MQDDITLLPTNYGHGHAGVQVGRHDSPSIDLPTIYVIGSIDVNKAHICVCLNKGHPTLKFRILYTEKC